GIRIPWFRQLTVRTSKARVLHSGADTLQAERDDGRRDSETSRDMPGSVSPRRGAFPENSISSFPSSLPLACSATPGAPWRWLHEAHAPVASRIAERVV